MFYNSSGGFQSIGYTLDGRVLALDTSAKLISWDLHSPRPEAIYWVTPPYTAAILKGLRSTRGHVSILAYSEFLSLDLTTKSELPLFDKERVHEVSEDGTLALVSEEGGRRWQLWEIETKKRLEYYFEMKRTGWVWFHYSPLLAPDNRTLAMSFDTGQPPLVWQRGNPEPKQLYPTTKSKSFPGLLYRHLAFSRDSCFLVGAQPVEKGLVSIWDLPEGRVRWSRPQLESVRALSIHPSGKFLALALEGGLAGNAVRFLDAVTGAELTRFNWKVGRIRCLAFSPDGLTCAAGCTNRRLVVWDVDL
jgi:WD40 repeat protein